MVVPFVELSEKNFESECEMRRAAQVIHRVLNFRFRATTFPIPLCREGNTSLLPQAGACHVSSADRFDLFDAMKTLLIQQVVDRIDDLVQQTQTLKSL